ncbi:hypothetical protein acdb102_02120 [Acidothermaceae bacterium B102]|nr:hypothetical protein acdb102_02120 [Acidothermaceae bacterium B102]
MTHHGDEPLTLSGLEEPPRWKYAPVLYVLGALTMLGGAVGLVLHMHRTHPFGTAIYYAGGAIAHDLVIAPIVIVVGLVVRAVVPSSYRPAVRGGLIVSGAVFVIALPLLLGKGREADNPSHVPLPYGRNLIIVLAVVWSMVALLCLVRALRAHPPHLRHRPHRGRKSAA